MDTHGLLADEVLGVPSWVVNFSRSSSREDAGRLASKEAIDRGLFDGGSSLKVCL
jgi:hypothetical protein